jgi:hypothetical membrane protein
MNLRIRFTFLILVLAQALHSAEEYISRFWEKFPPARILSDMVSVNTKKGFIIINVSLFLLGILTWLMITLNRNKKQFLPVIWFFIIIEFINGIGHPLWGILAGHYVPGLATSMLLFGVNIFLTMQVIKSSSVNRTRNDPDLME